MTKTEKLLRELIALPSVNPAFLPANHQRAGERNVAEFLAARAAETGLGVSFQKVVPGRSNLVARLTPSRPPSARILLAPHLDTINGTDEQFTPRKRHGRLYGRGACDTKGSVAAMFRALCELAQGPSRPKRTEVVLLGLIDEEDAQLGSRAAASSGLKADLAIVGEPTRLQVVTAHKGSLWLNLETRGRSAHGARPELGRNAVHEMARVVEVLETRYAQGLRRRRHPLLGCATSSVGVIRGGTQANIVPDRCQILVDRRTLPGETETGVGWEVRELLRQAGLQVWIGNGRSAPCPPLETDANLPLIRQFLAAARQQKTGGVDYFCDAALLAEAGIPSVVFGPGDIAQAHTADEWIALSSLERARELLLAFLHTLP